MEKKCQDWYRPSCLEEDRKERGDDRGGFLSSKGHARKVQRIEKDLLYDRSERGGRTETKKPNQDQKKKDREGIEEKGIH